MKRIILLLLAVICISGCAQIDSEAELIEAARQNIHEIADIDTIELAIAGSSSIDEDTLFWFISGNDHQMHRYIPIEYTKTNKDSYRFVKTYTPIKRGQDIVSLIWKDGYAFLINNPDCGSIRITRNQNEELITVDSLPFVYYYNGFPDEYVFLDADGNVLKH